MIETDEQRRWWFATHPEFSSSRKGTRGHKQGQEKEETGKVRPEDVDAYVDEALKYERGPVAELLKSVKRNFGTESQVAKTDQREDQSGSDSRAQQGVGRPAAWKDSYDKFEDALRRMKSNNRGYQENVEQGAKSSGVGLISDPHTALDLVPIGRFFKAGMQGVNSLLRRMARGAIVSAVKSGRKRWKVGDDPLVPTSKGNDPSFSAQRQRTWKNKAAEEGSVDKWGPDNIERMKKGRPPERINPNTGEVESKELHHPTPQREGGKEVMDLWPEEHAKVDPYRRLKKR